MARSATSTTWTRPRPFRNRRPVAGWYRAASLAELEAHLEHEFGREDVDTVGGLILAALGRVPRVNESVELGRYRLIVDQVVRRRVGRVIVEAVTPASLGVEGESR